MMVALILKKKKDRVNIRVNDHSYDRNHLLLLLLLHYTIIMLIII